MCRISKQQVISVPHGKGFSFNKKTNLHLTVKTQDQWLKIIEGASGSKDWRKISLEREGSQTWRIVDGEPHKTLFIRSVNEDIRDTCTS